MKIAVAGTGYVGLVSAVCFADKGHDVVCVDVDNAKIETMRKGISPIYEPGLEELMKKNEKRIEYTLDFKNAYRNADIIIVGVGTPEKKDGSANLQYVNKVLSEIKENIEQDCVVVIKSTVPIGTNDKAMEFFSDCKYKVSVVSNPEFLAQGTAVPDTLYPSRIVIGAYDKKAADIMLEAYKDFDAPKLVMNNTSAEMVKYASNDFLALKISFINEIANFCELVGANIEDVTKGMGLDPRIGNKFLNAGIGYGGSCFPKDTKALHWLANSKGHEMKTVKAAIDVNEQQKIRLYKKAEKYVKNYAGLKVAVLGVTFKPNTDDLREAPSIENIQLLLDDGANIVAYDPVGQENFKRKFPQVKFENTIEATIKDADICFVFTEWSDIKNIDIKKFKSLMKNAIVLDGRNCYNPKEMKDNGIIYESIGR